MDLDRTRPGAKDDVGKGAHRRAPGVDDLRLALEYPETRKRPSAAVVPGRGPGLRSEEHTSELQSLMRISYAVFCLKKKKLSNDRTTKYHEKKTQLAIDSE